KQALDLDPAFALAWAQLGGAYSIQAAQGWVPVAAGFAQAKEAVTQALALEPELAEAHAEMGFIQMVHDWNWLGAEASYRRALELAPGSTLALRRAGLLATNAGRIDEAIELDLRAV